MQYDKFRITEAHAMLKDTLGVVVVSRLSMKKFGNDEDAIVHGCNREKYDIKPL